MTRGRHRIGRPEVECGVEADADKGREREPPGCRGLECVGLHDTRAERNSVRRLALASQHGKRAGGQDDADGLPSETGTPWLKWATGAGS